MASILAYNEPPGPYDGLMETMASPQLRGLGAASERRRGQIRIASGQEYRSTTYGHLNLYWRDDTGARGPEDQCRQLAAVRSNSAGKQYEKADSLFTRTWRIFTGDPCRLCAKAGERRRATSVRSVSRNRADWLV